MGEITEEQKIFNKYFKMLFIEDDTEFVKQFKDIPNIEMRDKYGNTLLMLYVTHLHSFYEIRVPKSELALKRITYLIRRGASVNRRNKDKETVLSICASERSTEVFKYLLSLNSSIRLNTQENIDLIFQRVCMLNDIQLIKDLYKNCENNFISGVDDSVTINVDCRPKIDGKTPLMNALQCKCINVAKYLLELGADCSSFDKYGKSVLLYAFSCGDMDLFITILTKIFGNNYMNKIHNMKSIVELYGEIVIVEDEGDGEELDIDILIPENFIFKDFEKDKITYFGYDENGNKNQLSIIEFTNLLKYAINSNNLDIVKFAFEFPIDVNFTEGEIFRNKKTGENIKMNETSPLMHAASIGNIEIVKYLISKGANIHYNSVLSFVYDCLTSAVSCGKIEIVKLFIELGVKLNYECEDYNALRTALERASRNFRKEMEEKHIKMYEKYEQIVILLLENGANPNKYTGSDMGYTSSSMLFMPCSWHMNNILKELLKHGADVNYFDGDGDNVVRRCIESENEEGLKMVLDHGFDINKLNEEEHGFVLSYILQNSLAGQFSF